ncbi:MAG TPA: hypothetical protein VJZ71_04585 [Phycisphaerae bacterium]|nr:hypothetical protein [Phycisphaerae bacterium]
MKTRFAKIALQYVSLTLLFYPLGVLCHELIGHGLMGVLFGGRITQVEILAFRVWPEIQFLGWSGRYGACEVVGITSPVGEALMSLAGAMSTFCVAVIATILLWTRPGAPGGRIARPILITLGLWWIDLLTYTLPSWGLPRSILWGQQTYSEPYEAAKSLGIPGPAFQAFVMIACTILLFALIARVRRDAIVQHSTPAPASSRD